MNSILDGPEVRDCVVDFVGFYFLVVLRPVEALLTLVELRRLVGGCCLFSCRGSYATIRMPLFD